MPVINLLANISYLSWVLGELSVGKPFKFGRLLFIGTAYTAGFNNVSTGTAIDYTYDLNGNMVKDLNKGIGTTSLNGITYNHLNLPDKITFTGTNKIEYTYAADGRKLQKKVANASVVNTTQYDHGFQYENAALKFFPQQEGFIDLQISLGC